MAWYDDYLRAWDSHDAQRITSSMTPNVTYTDVALGETHGVLHRLLVRYGFRLLHRQRLRAGVGAEGHQ